MPQTAKTIVFIVVAILIIGGIALAANGRSNVTGPIDYTLIIILLIKEVILTMNQLSFLQQQVNQQLPRHTRSHKLRLMHRQWIVGQQSMDRYTTSHLLSVIIREDKLF
jgi:hypothetical protein